MTPEQYRDDAILDAQRAQEAQGEESAYIGMVWLGDDDGEEGEQC